MAGRNEHTWVPVSRLRYLIIYWLYYMPLLSAGEIALIFRLPESTVRDCLASLAREGRIFAVEVGAGQRLSSRYALTLSGLDERCRSFKWSLRAVSHASQSGLERLLQQLPMLEAFYRLAINLFRYPNIGDYCEEVQWELDNPEGPEVRYIRGASLVLFKWHSEGELHATAYYCRPGEPCLDVGFRWFGPARTSITLPGIDPDVHPRTSVLVFADPIQEIRSRSLLEKVARSNDPLAPAFIPVLRDGAAKGEPAVTPRRSLRLSPLGMVYTERIGIPENILALVVQVEGEDPPKPALANRSVAAVSDMRARRVFEWVEGWRGSNLTVVARGCRMSRKVANQILSDLSDAGLVIKLGGGYYLDEEGIKLVAVRDRISVDVVRDRHAVYLKRDARYRKQQQRHSLGMARLAALVCSLGADQGFGISPGELWVVQLRHSSLGQTQLKPDAWLRLPITGGEYAGQLVSIPFEYELTAVTEEQVRRKLEPWVKAKLFGRPCPVFFLTGTAEARDLFARIARELGIPLVAATEADFIRALSTYPRAGNTGPEPEAAAIRSGDRWVKLSDVAAHIPYRKGWKRPDLLQRFEPLIVQEVQDLDDVHPGALDGTYFEANQGLFAALEQ